MSHRRQPILRTQSSTEPAAVAIPVMFLEPRASYHERAEALRLMAPKRKPTLWDKKAPKSKAKRRAPTPLDELDTVEMD